MQRFGRFRGEADVNGQSKPAESVEDAGGDNERPQFAARQRERSLVIARHRYGRPRTGRRHDRTIF